MNIEDGMIAWNHGGPIEVGRHPDTTGWTDTYQATSGACFSDWRPAVRKGQLTNMLHALFIALTVRDLVPPEQVHQAFLDFYGEHYVAGLPIDVPGVLRVDRGWE